MRDIELKHVYFAMGPFLCKGLSRVQEGEGQLLEELP